MFLNDGSQETNQYKLRMNWNFEAGKYVQLAWYNSTSTRKTSNKQIIKQTCEINKADNGKALKSFEI